MVRKRVRAKSGASSRNLSRSTPSEGDSGQKDPKAETTTRTSTRTRKRPCSFAKAEDDTRSAEKKSRHHEFDPILLVFIHDHGLRVFELSRPFLELTPTKMDLLFKADAKTNGEWTAVQAVKRACGLLEKRGIPRRKDGEAYARDPSVSKGERETLKLYWSTLGHGEWADLELHDMGEADFLRKYDGGEPFLPERASSCVVDLRDESAARCLEREQKLRAAQEQEYRIGKEKRREAKKTKKSGKEPAKEKEKAGENAAGPASENGKQDYKARFDEFARGLLELAKTRAARKEEEKHGGDPASLEDGEELLPDADAEGRGEEEEGAEWGPEEFSFSDTGGDPARTHSVPSPPTEDEGAQPYLFDDDLRMESSEDGIPPVAEDENSDAECDGEDHRNEETTDGKGKSEEEEGEKRGLTVTFVGGPGFRIVKGHQDDVDEYIHERAKQVFPDDDDDDDEEDRSHGEEEEEVERGEEKKTPSEQQSEG